MTYFDAFLPDHGPHPYHLSLLESHHHHNPLPPPPQAITVRLISQFTGWPILIATEGAVSGLTHFFQSGLSNGYLLTERHINLVYHPALSARRPADLLTGCGALLLPPDKPPIA